MKRSVSVIISIVFAAVFAASALAQPGAGKIGWIETAAFGGDEKGLGGVTKYVNAMKALDAEFGPTNTALQTKMTRYTTLGNEIKKLQEAPANLIDQKTISAKVDEAQQLEIQIKRDQEDAKAKYERRQAQVLRPISQEIGQAIEVFAKQKGYTAILDISAFAQANAILSLDVTADLTKEFITFFNARPPAGTASTGTPTKTP